MKRVITQIALALIAIAVSHFGFETKACSCGGRNSPYQEFSGSRAVFVGRVTGSRDVAVIERLRDKTYTAYERMFRFAVSESFKGLKDSQIEINVGRIDSMCYTGFTIGNSYLVYAFGDSGTNLESGFCDRTSDLRYAADDLHYIRDLLKGVPEPRIYGSVMRIDNNLTGIGETRQIAPMEGIKVLIEGKGKRVEAVTDKQGLYRLAKIPDGRYKARLMLPRGYMTYFPAEEEFVLGSQPQPGPVVPAGDTAYARFRIGWNNHLNGRIIDSEGNPIIRAKVAVMVAGNTSPLVIEQDAFDYHEEGKFQFYGLTPGKYLLSVNIQVPFSDASKPTRFYYPNTDDLGLARELTISENETVEDRDIRLPPEYVVRQIEGVLVWPNGVPVSRGRVFLSPSKDPADDAKKYDWVTTDELGTFSLQAFVGAEYWLHGESNSSGRGEPIAIKVSKLNKPLKVVIPFPKRLEP